MEDPIMQCVARRLIPVLRSSSTARGLGQHHRRVRLIVLERDGHRCHWCGGPATEADHLVERDRGGPSSPDNMVAACRRCNAARGARYVNAKRARRRRHPFFDAGDQDPAAVVVPSPAPSERRLSSPLDALRWADGP